MRLLSIATQSLPAVATSPRKKMVMRSRSCDEIEVVQEITTKSAQLLHKGTSYFHVWQMVKLTGKDRKRHGAVHRQGDNRKRRG